MRIEAIFPFPNLCNLFVAMFIFLVVIRPGWVVNVVPILHKLRFLVLLALLASTSLSLLARVKAIDIVVVVSGPVCQTTNGGSSCWRRGSGRGSSIIASSSRSGFW